MTHQLTRTERIAKKWQRLSTTDKCLIYGSAWMLANLAVMFAAFMTA